MQIESGKTALFFGSFDPVHIGHLIIAEYFLNSKEFDDVWFVITPRNPFKVNNTLTDEMMRKTMLELATKDIKNFRVCDIEFSMPAPNYTYKTLIKLKEVYPEKDFAMIIGGDNLQDFDKWKNFTEILDMLPVYVYPRPGFESNTLDHYTQIHKTNAPIIEVSSSEIKKNLAEGLSARFLLHPRVYEYIRMNKLYSSPNSFRSTST